MTTTLFVTKPVDFDLLKTIINAQFKIPGPLMLSAF